MQNLVQHILGSLGLGRPQPPAAPPPTEPAQRVTQRITIAGVGPATVSASFLKAYGFEPACVVDVGQASAQSSAAQTTEALALVYAEGGTRGPAAAAVANGIRQLEPNETLYFVLTGPAAARKQELQAFVHTTEASRG